MRNETENIFLPSLKGAYPLGDQVADRLDCPPTADRSAGNRRSAIGSQSAGDWILCIPTRTGLPPIGGKPVRLRLRVLRGETPTKMDDDMMFFQFAALIVANELMFGEGNQEYKPVHRYWVRPWIGRRDNSDTAFTLMRELQAVSNNLV